MWHYHEEIELVYIVKGSGVQFIAENIHYFKPGDLIMFGSFLPHLWRSDEQYLKPNSEEKVEAIVLHFSPDCLGKGFFNLPENKELLKLLENAKRAIRIYGDTRDTVAALMKRLLHAEKSERIIFLLQILDKIAYSKEVKTVNKNLTVHNSPTEVDRLNNVYQHLLDNYTHEIPLQEIAEIANISPPAFCRYFKARTRKTFSAFLLELRVAHAAKLLIESNLPVSEICYQSGFNNFSHFNKHFKTLIGRTPLQHRKFMSQ